MKLGSVRTPLRTGLRRAISSKLSVRNRNLKGFKLNCKMNYHIKTALISTIIFLIASIAVESIQLSTEKDHQHELKLVHVIWRHGDRNPEWAYPNDPYKSLSFWPDGLGQLTNIGKEQHRELGSFLRNRYDGFVKGHYDPREVFIQSSLVNRTVLSALYNSQAFFKSSTEKYVFPVQIIPKEKDNKLLVVSAPCPKREKAYDDFIQDSPLIRGLISKHAWLFEYLTHHSGMVIDSLHKVNQLYNILFIQNLKNFTLPEWTKRVFPGGIMEELASFSFKTITFTDELKLLRGGPLLKEMFDHMEYKIGGRAGFKYRKLFAYSAHDTTLTTVMDSLGVFDIHTPSYASALIIELRKNSSLEGKGRDNYFVNILYRNDTRREPYVLHPVGCHTASCDFTTIRKLVGKYLPKNWQRDCIV